LFNITFDGREIISGDIISSEPEVVITLEDNSPLPLDSTYFTLVHTYKNIPKVLSVPGPDVKFVTTPYPNNKAIITWTPKLEDGRHVLEVLAKDASGNFFDSTSSRSVFNVFNNPDLLQVYNYPNPFSDNTYFTFELRGVLPPEEFKIKIFTVAGRLIREIIPTTPLQIGFNKIYWDGKDEDGDEIANGLYFYKIISKHNGEIKTTIQKLAKVK
ncbi:MAG: T9SS type A sorting domain-containing protein, partial [Ignavibacteriaceae bacterium]|nr:T9SS type A sorting domain-containing protein [Ignavibacteriaceae bacterium]HRN27512.1 T9SS type A sorting domain-containing protein [Ignavibacteriaceae bacterium]HRQ55192.1 T9SS type A sorting domain-containing protein [Ignavibacteriaceae bacterium]